MKGIPMKVIQTWFLAVSVATLTACGGGGGGATATSSASNQSAEGLWQGTTSDGYNLTAAVLENGAIWALSSSADGVVGFVNGSSSVSGSAVSGTTTSYNLVNNTYATQSITGTVSTKNTLSLTTPNGSFNAAYVAGYDQAPTALSAMAGTYSGWISSVSGAFSPSSVVTISSAGQISSVGAICSATGSITPRASGKNLYDVTVGFSGANCTAFTYSLTGVAAYNNTSGVLLILALNGAKTDGVVYSATKQSNVTTTFPLRSSYQSYVVQGSSNNYTISGTCSGSASETSAAAVSATFEGVTGHSATTTVTGSYSNCTPASFAGTSVSYFDANYKPIGGVVAGTEYTVISSSIELPATVVVGDTAQFGSVDVYSSSTKATRTGTRVLSYVVEPGTSSSNATVNLIARAYNLSNQLLFTQQSRYRLTTAGQLTAVSKDIQYSTTSTMHLVWTKN